MKKIVSAFTLDTIIQIAFGMKIDSMAGKESPIVTNSYRLLSSDFSVTDIVIGIITSVAPRISNLLGLRIQKEAIEYFSKIAEEIIDRKRKELKETSSTVSAESGRAANFVELLLEAEAEANKGDDGEEKKSKCRFGQ